jgi:hypothetical protein
MRRERASTLRGCAAEVPQSGARRFQVVGHGLEFASQDSPTRQPIGSSQDVYVV